MKTLDRNQFVARKIGKLNGEIVIDLGCRNKILKEYLTGKFEYYPVDFNPSINNADFINHNLENGLPKELGKIDIITAIDVLEHINNIHLIYEGQKHEDDQANKGAREYKNLEDEYVISFQKSPPSKYYDLIETKKSHGKKVKTRILKFNENAMKYE
jgi:hypothetical protein